MDGKSIMGKPEMVEGKFSRGARAMASREQFEEYCQSDRSICKGKICKDCLWDWVEKQRKEEQGKVIEYINKKCKGCVGIKVNAKKDCTGCNIKGLSKAINKIYGGGE